MAFSEEMRSYAETRTRTSTQYVKFSPDYRVILRILNTNARTIWKHWIPQANGGKGFGVNCPNTSSQVRPCPIEKLVEKLPEDDPKRNEMRARRRFVVNVLDRTPHATCESCGNLTPGKKCQFCGASLAKAEFQPLNRVKILEGGPELFNKTLNPIDKMYKEDHNVDITGYDISFMTQGVGRDRQIAATPMTPADLASDAFLDENGEEQKLFDLDLLSEPTSVEEIEAFLRGATIKEVNELRGV